MQTDDAVALAAAGRDVPETIAMFALQKLAEDSRMSSYTMQRAAKFFMKAASRLNSAVWELR